MIYKLKESSLNLSEIKELKCLKVKDYVIKDFILLPDVDNFPVNKNNIKQESLVDSFNYVKKNDKIIIKNFPSKIVNNNEEENKADNSVSDHDNIGESKKHKNKMFMYPNKDFEERNFDIEKEINIFIKKLKKQKIKRKIKNIKFEEELYTVYNSDKLKELLKQIIIKDNSPINKLIENSQFLAVRFLFKYQN